MKVNDLELKNLKSIFNNSVIADYSNVLQPVFDFERPDEDSYETVVNAFVSECSETFNATFDKERADSDTQAHPFETRQDYIIKLMEDVGYNMQMPMYPLLSQLVSLKMQAPYTQFNELVEKVSSITGVPTNHIYRYLYSSFTYYNKDACDRAHFMIGTTPFTSKDLLDDVATYVRVKHILMSVNKHGQSTR